MPTDQQATVEPAVYDPSQSSTFHPMVGCMYDVAYGDGSQSSGTVAQFDVNIGGVELAVPIGICINLTYGPAETSRNTDRPVGLIFSSGNSSLFSQINIYESPY